MIFRLHRIGFWGKVGLATEHEIPRFTPDCTARHWRALLFLGFAYSIVIRQDAATSRVTAEHESFSDSCRDEFSLPG
jgi:hypothetical protein